MVKPDCDTCKALKGDKFDPDHCKICLPPLMPENEDAFMIYSIVQDQYIMGFDGPVGIDQNAIHNAMRLYGICNRLECFEKVITLGRHIVQVQHERAKRNKK